jgi:Protein of unknown function (DUF3106)
MHGLGLRSRFPQQLPHSFAAALCAVAFLLSGAVLAAAPSNPTSASGSVQTPPAKPGTRVAQAQVRGETHPTWSELGGEQRAALQPLAGSWAGLSEPQKRKWIALSRNFSRMSPPEQSKLHSRMNEWVALSPQQRAQARLNFGETKDLSADDKKAKWEAYQALSPEEKRKLAAGARPRTPQTAAAVKPVPAQKLANVPRNERRTKQPRIASGAEGDAQAIPAPIAPANAN